MPNFSQTKENKEKNYIKLRFNFHFYLKLNKHTTQINKHTSNKPKQLMPTEFKFYAILGKALNNYLGPSVLVVEDTVSWQFST